MKINGTHLSTVGFFPARGRDIPRLGGERTTTAALPGRAAIRTGAAIQPQSLIINGFLRGATHAQLLERVDALATLLQGEVRIQPDDYLAREWVGRLQQASGIEEIGADEITTEAEVRLDFLLADPAATDIAETVAGPGALVLGSAPSPLRVTITNGGTNTLTAAIVRVRAGGAAGAILRELHWTGELPINQALVIDASRFRVTAAGDNALGGITEASRFPIADPADGADHVTVSLTGGTGAATEVRYRRRWA